jgi:hypothetical protein
MAANHSYFLPKESNIRNPISLSYFLKIIWKFKKLKSDICESVQSPRTGFKVEQNSGFSGRVRPPRTARRVANVSVPWDPGKSIKFSNKLW